ncbi:FmdB family zinc ribbon protein [Nonomuraea diastatica]|uniref:FmdB family transcriptional regulator n=1 Tax=Nonomuraea diastatica TaxID=1848329 RepID=A0A4R4VT83_9ACTN|nr:FmdB family zinc ribbon protein [Nonomuraea diastatica]TDD05585.1 FmdB family transcriptional regulator [Nonomuraea diastatica]
MPTYQYACNDCGEQLEVVQKFTDDALTVCPSCEGNLRKVFSAVGIVFKGSGFYKTDSRSSTSGASTSSASSSSADSSSADSSSKSSESKSGDSGSSAPAPAPAAASN